VVVAGLIELGGHWSQLALAEDGEKKGGNEDVAYSTFKNYLALAIMIT
jgi:hypothetical protein